ncbi:MAG: hypothetical protein IKO40_09360 [Kiritimatiellae bacterium]|nr:hypothetical protein [Kiritimatiellia bacterium]
MGKRHPVLSGLRNVVVHLAKRVLAGEPNLAGVVFAGRNRMELLERDVDVGEIDGHGVSDYAKIV